MKRSPLVVAIAAVVVALSAAVIAPQDRVVDLDVSHAVRPPTVAVASGAPVVPPDVQMGAELEPAPAPEPPAPEPEPAPAPVVVASPQPAPPPPPPTPVAYASSLYPCGGDLPPCWVAQRESKGDYRIWNGGCYNGPCPGAASWASGKWQFLPSTWGGFGGYYNAADAPPELQDERARQVWRGGAGCSNWSAC